MKTSSLSHRSPITPVIRTATTHQRFSIRLLGWLSLLCLVLALSASLLYGPMTWAQNAPGEDPVVLSNRVGVQMLPVGNTRTSSPMSPVTDMPAWLKAKVVRYEAKANSDQTTGIATDADVTRTASSDGLKKTCVQEVGSVTTTTSNASGAGRNVPQVVVLKGDLVNICK